MGLSITQITEPSMSFPALTLQNKHAEFWDSQLMHPLGLSKRVWGLVMTCVWGRKVRTETQPRREVGVTEAGMCRRGAW